MGQALADREYMENEEGVVAGSYRVALHSLELGLYPSSEEVKVSLGSFSSHFM